MTDPAGDGATSAGLPPGWERDSDTLYLHAGGARIERRIYRKVEGWILVPADLDHAALTFPPDDAGRAAAFAAFAAFAAGAAGTGPEEVSRGTQEARDAARLEESDEDVRDEKEDDEDEDEGETT